MHCDWVLPSALAKFMFASPGFITSCVVHHTVDPEVHNFLEVTENQATKINAWLITLYMCRQLSKCWITSGIWVNFLYFGVHRTHV